MTRQLAGGSERRGGRADLALEDLAIGPKRLNPRLLSARNVVRDLQLPNLVYLVSKWRIDGQAAGHEGRQKERGKQVHGERAGGTGIRASEQSTSSRSCGDTARIAQPV